MSQTALRWALLLVAAALLGTLVSGCGGSSSSSNGIDVPGLEHELATVIRLAKLGEGLEFDVRVACAEQGADRLNYSCRVDITSRGTPVNSWTEPVGCSAPGVAAGPRCVSESGYALQ